MSSWPFHSISRYSSFDISDLHRYASTIRRDQSFSSVHLQSSSSYLIALLCHIGTHRSYHSPQSNVTNLFRRYYNGGSLTWKDFWCSLSGSFFRDYYSRLFFLTSSISYWTTVPFIFRIYAWYNYWMRSGRIIRLRTLREPTSDFQRSWHASLFVFMCHEGTLPSYIAY